MEWVYTCRVITIRCAVHGEKTGYDVTAQDVDTGYQLTFFSEKNAFAPDQKIEVVLTVKW